MTTSLRALANRVQIGSTWLGPGEQDRDRWRVTLGYRGSVMTLDFAKGAQHHGTKPTRVEVLTILLDEAATVDTYPEFKEWAAAHAVNPDRYAERFYQQVRAQADRFRRLLGDSYETFQEATR